MTRTRITRDITRLLGITRVLFVISQLCFYVNGEISGSGSGSGQVPMMGSGLNNKQQSELSTYDYSQYQRYEDIVRELKRIVSRNRKERELFSIGETFENRTLWAIKLKQITPGKRFKKYIFIDCGAHAREWVAPSTCMYVINEMTSRGGKLRKLLRMYNWVFVPLLNPDGYAFTWSSPKNRMWRKNRSYDDKQMKKFKETGDPMCIGVDINRNYNISWGGVGAPTENPCDETYAGSEAFSERESSALSKYLTSIENDTICYVCLHTFGQLWMTPYGHTSKRPKDYQELKRVAKLAVKAMKNNSGVEYEVGPSHDVLYAHSGNSGDWVRSELDIPYTYLVEMMPKDDGNGSFKIPAEAMVRNAKDIMVGLLTMAENMKEDIDWD